MMKRLFILLLLVAATVVASPPAHASTLTVHMSCEHTSSDPSRTYRFFSCWAFASGGSPSYTFQWYHLYNGVWSFAGQESGTGSSQIMDLPCNGDRGTARVVVTDSAGAQVSMTSTAYCSYWGP